jgi:hypothetical protein
MPGNFSLDPAEVLRANLEKGYVRARLEQGVPLLDRDVNLIVDLVAETVRQIISRYIGDGIAERDDGFAIEAVAGVDNDFWIRGPTTGDGYFLVGGNEVRITDEVRYSMQTDFPEGAPPAFAAPTGTELTRTDLVYLDAWMVEVDDSTDPDLLNPEDVGVRTSVRFVSRWVVRVRERAEVVPRQGDPDWVEGHTYAPLASIQRTQGAEEITAEDITDLRQTRLTLADIEQRLRVVEEQAVVPSFDQDDPFDPNFVNAGETVTLHGTHFDIGTVVVAFINTADESLTVMTDVTVVSDEQVDVVVEPSLATGTYRIRLTNDGGTTETTAAIAVVGGGPVVVDPPTFDVGDPFDPNMVSVGDVVTLHGTNFDGSGLSVSLIATSDNAVTNVPSPTVVDSERIDFTVPAVPTGTYTIDVTTDGGTANSVSTIAIL